MPTGPKGHWLAGSLPDFRKARLDFLTNCARDFGDMVWIRLAHRRVYLAHHPDLIERGDLGDCDVRVAHEL